MSYDTVSDDIDKTNHMTCLVSLDCVIVVFVAV